MLMVRSHFDANGNEISMSHGTLGKKTPVNWHRGAKKALNKGLWDKRGGLERVFVCTDVCMDDEYLERVETLCDCIETEAARYPIKPYSPKAGPNSNTFASMVLDACFADVICGKEPDFPFSAHGHNKRPLELYPAAGTRAELDVQFPEQGPLQIVRVPHGAHRYESGRHRDKGL